MADKEKGKSNPFVGVLHEDEEILWFYKRLPLTFGAHLKGYIVRGLVSILIISFTIGWCLFVSALVNSAKADWKVPRTFPFPGNMITGLSLTLLTLGPVLLIAYPLFWILNTRVNEAYALTQERLLRYSHHRLSDVKLESISSLSAHRRTISFDSREIWFPYWRDIEDAGDVVQFIEQARAIRLKTFSELEQNV